MFESESLSPDHFISVKKINPSGTPNLLFESCGPKIPWVPSYMPLALSLKPFVPFVQPYYLKLLFTRSVERLVR